MALPLIYPIVKSCFTLANTSTSGTSTAFSIPIADSYTFYLQVATAQTTCATVFLTSIDQGTTYVAVPWKFAGVTTVTGTFVLNVASGLGSGTDVSLPTGQGSFVDATGTGTTALGLRSVVDPRYMKIAYTLSGNSSWTLYCAAWPRGATLGVD